MAVCLFVCFQVRHSQKMNETALKPWVIAFQSGIVESAHCNCMAGLGESCTHVGALLFFTMEAQRIATEKTVTQEKAYWMLPNSIDKVPNIDFTTAAVERIQPIGVIQQEIISKSKEYFVKVVLPELTSNIVTREISTKKAASSSDSQTNIPTSTTSAGKSDLICVCQQAYDEYGDNVIGCDNDKCQYGWLHYSCVNLKKVPKGAYFCPECKSFQRKEKRSKIPKKIKTEVLL